ncbi:MAG: MFS transporter [Gemmataceae bacterium]|nr:MFS transporter [Gemmataceae bacterium]MCI0743737.1 MFS transporter [Gemmataceae bacterium]
MANATEARSGAGKWMALTAALLGWMFDGLEMGLFPLVARPALIDLGVPSADVANWLGIITALFLVGAATGGVLFGWLGDRIGRVRAMMLSVLTYALVSGMAGFATEAWQVGALRFLAALGMGGEWSLGVALINEIWPDRSRAFLAGLVGAAANVGFLFIALIGRGLATYVLEIKVWLVEMGLPDSWVQYLFSSDNSGWRLLMMMGALPALLTFFIRLFVPESHRWEHERARGATSYWANRDLLAVLVGAGAACGIVVLWAIEMPVVIQLFGTLVGLAVVTGGYMFPVAQYLRRLSQSSSEKVEWKPILRLMFLAACLSGVALLGTWGSIQQAPSFADELAGATIPTARSDTQIWSSIGAIIGTILAALAAGALGRRVTYFVMCLASMAIIPTIFLTQETVGVTFLFLSFLGGAITASFYGWLPLYLPELFQTRVRATGQGFGFNFGRILAAIGVLQLGNLKDLVKPYGWGLAEVCSMLSAIYLVGLVLIWFAPETKGKPLPE